MFVRKNFSFCFSIHVIFALALAITVAPVWAINDFEEDPFLEDFPVILSVTRLPQKINKLPASVTVIDREMIDASGATEIAELFRMVPGFQVGHYIAADGHRTSVTYHGNSDQYSRRMQVMIDGRSVYLPSTGGVSWDDLPIGMNEIDHIEVIRGPNGATYGVNSFLGVINIITLHAEATHGDEYSLISSSQKDYSAGVRIGGRKGNLDYRFNLQYKATDGFEDSLEFSKEQNDDSSTLKLNIQTDYQIGVNDSLSLSLGYLIGDREVGFSDGGLNPLTDQQLDPLHIQQVTSSYQNLKFQHIISSEQEVNLHLYHNVHNLKSRYQTSLVSELMTSYGIQWADLNGNNSPDLPAELIDTNMNSVITTAEIEAFFAGYTDSPVDRNGGLFDERVGVELSHQTRIGKGIRVVWGGELRQDRFRGYDWVGTSDTFTNNTQRLFFNSELSPTENWTINIGDMLEKSDYMSLKHSPRMTLSWDVAKNHYIRMGYSRAWRSPSFIESEFNYSLTLVPNTPLIYPLYRNNEVLRPERIDVREIVFGGGTRAKGATYELRLFQEEISDILIMPKDTSLGYNVVTNDGQSHVRGSELALTLYPLQPGSTLRISYSKLTPSGETDTRYVLKNIADLVPEETLNLLFSQKIGRGGLLGVNLYQVSRMQFIAGNMNSGFSTMNISYQHSINILGHDAKVILGAQDVLGNYFDFSKETVNKPKIYLGIKGGF